MKKSDEYYKLACQYANGFDEDGNDCEEDEGKAIYYFKLADEFGHGDAAKDLGAFLLVIGNYSEAQKWLEKAFKSGKKEAANDLVMLFEETKNWSSLLDVFFKSTHSDKECEKIIGILDNYYNSLHSTMIANNSSLQKEFYKITDWKNNPWCTDSLRKKLLQLREQIVELLIRQEIKEADNLAVIHELEKILDKCKKLKTDVSILGMLYKKEVALELQANGVNSYQNLFDRYKSSMYYPFIREQIYLQAGQIYLRGTNQTPKNVLKAIQIVSQNLGTTASTFDFYNEAFDAIDLLAREGRASEALKCLGYMPTQSYPNRSENLIKKLEKIKIEQLEKLPNDCTMEKLKLANIYLFSKYKEFNNPDRGFLLLNNLFEKYHMSEAAKLMMDYLYTFTAENEIPIYELVEKALAFNIPVNQKYLDIHARIKNINVERVKMKEKIRQEAQRRGIKYLVHFTHRENLNSILENGILSRNALERKMIPHKYTDSNRVDGERDYISTSITNPNKYMLDNKMKEIGMDPVLIYLDASILWDMNIDIVFYVTNAATTRMNHRSGSGYNAFLDMFSNEITIETSTDVRFLYRSRQEINEPTDAQAEVMVKDYIPVKYIRKVEYYKTRETKVYNGDDY